MSNYIVFYGTQVHSEHTKWPRMDDLGPEVYNGCYVYARGSRKWYLADQTPPLDIENVPKELRTLVLLLT